MKKLKVLFFAEGATLAHVARPFVVARSLDPERFEVIFARPDTFEWLTKNTPFPTRPLACQAPSVFARRLEYGLPLYDLPTLRGYVADDLSLIDTEHPDVIVGDFRLSLAVSARLRNVPYATICDAYWSPRRPFDTPLPVLAFTRFTPISLATAIFRAVSPLALRLHAHPMERLRAQHGLPSLGHDLRRCYTDADLRLYANFPELFPDVPTGPKAMFIGPVAWSPAAPAGPIPFVDGEEHPIYVTMGSSGDPHVLGALLPLLEELGLPTLVATAGKPIPALPHSDRVRVFDYLPGDLVCRHATLVICNGGSPTTNQALSCGVPVLGIARNMDQFLNMQAIEHIGAGLTVRADRATPGGLRAAVTALLNTPQFAARARTLAGPPVPSSDVAERLMDLVGGFVSANFTYSSKHPPKAP